MENTFVWASAHNPTQEQLSELNNLLFLKDMDSDLFAQITNLQSGSNLELLAKRLVRFAIANNAVLVQPAGSPAFHMKLGLAAAGLIEVWFSFSQRISEDIPQADGSVKKVSVFRHECWI